MSSLIEQIAPNFEYERSQLGLWPTEIQRLTAMDSDHARMWCKREDRSGEIYGGNKVRKLEWLLPYAAKRSSSVLSMGATGSNHLLATCKYAPRFGLDVHAVVSPQPSTPHVEKNRAAIEASGATLWRSSSQWGVPFKIAQAWLSIRRETGKAPVWIRAGGSNAIGSLGWVEAALEIGEQVKAGGMPEPSHVVVPLGSGGTVAGLLVGLQLAGLSSRVYGVRVVSRAFVNRRNTLSLARATLSLIDKTKKLDASRLTVDHEFYGAGYGESTESGLAAIAIAADSGLILEPTYTGKALAGGLAAMEKGVICGDVLYIDTVSSVDM
jgi:D-cysteine desulfhydrase